MFTREQIRKVMQRLEQNARPEAFESQQAKRTLRHARHFFLQIGANVSSLSTALVCTNDTVLAGNWVQLLLRSSSSADGRHEMILQHVFSTLLRLHDGLILITSGECRHAADIRAARSSQCPSQLTASSSGVGDDNGDSDMVKGGGGGGDGYTSLYRKDSVYSGTGWDEWTDSQNGLQGRLVRASGKKNWDALSRGTGIGPMLDQLESEIRSLEDAFASLKAAVESALVPPLQKKLRTANVKVKLSFQCKMERMTVVAPAAKYNMELMRLAGQFQLGGTVLPQGLDRQQWEKLLRYDSPSQPASSNTQTPDEITGTASCKRNKRKRPNLFVDSVDEEADPTGESLTTETLQVDGRDSPVSKPASTTGASTALLPIATARVTATGLVVQQKQKADPSSRNNTTMDRSCDSINVIKASMGVDVNDLEAAHEALREEETEADREAQRIDCLEEMENQEVLYKRLRKQLNRALRRDRNLPHHDDLLWELRDRVRLAAMAAGNKNLWAREVVASPDDRTERRKGLEKALYFFKQAQELVDDQERLHAQITSRQCDSEATSSVFQRNLLLLRSQAHVNAGIALVELVRLKTKSRWKEQAFCEFQAAQTAAESLGHLSGRDTGSSIDAMIDQLKSKELDLLTARWRGTLLWMTGETARATQLLQKAATTSVEFDDGAMSDTVNECVEAMLKIGIESYLSGATLADLVLGDLEAVSTAMIRREESKCDALMKSFEGVIGILVTKSRLLIASFATIESAWLADQDLLEENGILHEGELHTLLQETQDWWSKKKALSLRCIVPEQRQEGTSRKILSTSVLNEDEEDEGEPIRAPPRRLVVYGSSSFPRKPRRRRPMTVMGSSSAGPTIRRPQAPSSQPQLQKYRRWGDELLPQVMDENGKLVPKLSYPSIAPEMPPEIKERLEARRRENSSRII
jgi:hypothetical protein